MSNILESSRNRLPLIVFCTALIGLLIGGCAAKQGLAPPQIYGENSYGDQNRTADTSETDNSGGEDRETVLAAESSEPDLPKDVSPADESEQMGGGEGAPIPHSEVLVQEDSGQIEPGNDFARLQQQEVINADSVSAIDDDLWRQFDLAEEYQAMGAIANREASWEEAQYYFEKCLKILANIDIESDSLMTPEGAKYNRILSDVIADYRVTLRSLGRLEGDVTPSILVERFGDVEEGLSDDSLRVYRQEEQRSTYDLPVVMNDRVRKSIIYFQTVANEAFRKYLSRSRRYAWLFDEVLKEHGLPNDLVYLSLVESGFNPHAYSWARAMGLWQFISSTGRLYGLDRSWWYDERKDPVKSTRAAARFLKDLYEQFGDWELAMAAYNGGPRRVERTIERQGTTDFWSMRLKRQTMDYVPLIYAAAIICKDPEKYGFTDIEFEPPVVWDEVTISRCLDLKVVARELGCSLSDLKNLNPELLRNYTPPNTKEYKLKVPVGTKEKFWAAYDDMPSPKETSWVKHQIRRGETVSTIAAKYGVSQYAVLEANNLSRRSKIYAGKHLIVPVPLDRGYHSSRSTREYSANNSVYAVRAGDTMWDIARAFGTSVDALRRINYIGRSSRIYVGQKLKIPSNATRLKSQNTGSPGTYASTGNGSTSSSGRKVHTVRAGDSLWDIARKYGTTTSQLRRLNALGRSSRIYPGQNLVISTGGDTKYVLYRVRRGDTLSRIARKYRTSVSRILAANGITDPDNIRIGEQIKIYVR